MIFAYILGVAGLLLLADFVGKQINWRPAKETFTKFCRSLSRFQRWVFWMICYASGTAIIYYTLGLPQEKLTDAGIASGMFIVAVIFTSIQIYLKRY